MPSQSNRFDFVSPLRISEQNVFTRIDFGPASAGPEIVRLRQTMNASLLRLAEALPESLREEANTILHGYADGDFFRLYYVPMWSFLHHVMERCGESRFNLAAQDDAREAHAMALFLHLLDDHLCDGQLRTTMLLLQLRTLAWQRFLSSSHSLSLRLCLDPNLFDKHTGSYITSLHRTEQVPGVEAYEHRFRRQMGICTLVPRLVGYASSGQAGSESLVGIIEDFGIAWRLLDDIQDIGADSCKGEQTSVWLELDGEGRRCWEACRERFAAEGSLDPVLFNKLTASIQETGCLYRLFVRIGQKLLGAARSAESQGWLDMALELEQCGQGIPVFYQTEG